MEDDIAALARQHVGVLVSLLQEPEAIELGLDEEAAACATHGIEFLSQPVADLGVPRDPPEFIATAHRLVRALRDGATIAIHCRQSVGRSGLLAVSIAIASGMPLDVALDVVSTARGVVVPETTEQREWLRRHRDSLLPRVG